MHYAGNVRFLIYFWRARSTSRTNPGPVNGGMAVSPHVTNLRQSRDPGHARSARLAAKSIESTADTAIPLTTDGLSAIPHKLQYSLVQNRLPFPYKTWCPSKAILLEDQCSMLSVLFRASPPSLAVNILSLQQPRDFTSHPRLLLFSFFLLFCFVFLFFNQGHSLHLALQLCPQCLVFPLLSN